MTVQNLCPELQGERGSHVADLLLQLVRAAVQLHTLGTQAEQTPESPASLDDELERLSNAFDHAHAEALGHGIPINTSFELDLGGVRYRLVLSEDSVEYLRLS